MISLDEQYNIDLTDAENKCKEIDYKIKQLGDLSTPTLNVVKEAIKECVDVENKTGFLFFCRAFCSVPHPTMGKISMKESIYNWQKIASIKFLKNTKFISKKTRQIGATTFVSTYFLWRALFFNNTSSFILSLGSRESSDVLSRVTFMYNNLPIWLRTPLLEGAKTSIKFKNNSGVTALPGTPEALRGRSASSIILDEFAFLQNAGRILSSAVPALSMGFLTPFSNYALPSQLFIISTLPLIDSDNNEYLRLYKNILNKESDMTLLDIKTDDIKEYRDQEWRKSMLETLGPKRFSVEILGELNSTLDNSFLPEWVIERLQPIHPIRTDFLRPEQVDDEGYARDMDLFVNSKENYDPSIGYMKGFWVWHDPLPGKNYGVACDVGAGVGSDFSAFHVFDLESGEQVAEFYNNKTNLEDYKNIINDVATYYNKAKLSIERNSLGAPIVSFFSDTLQYENFYYHRKSKSSYTPGFPVTAGNRGGMLASLQSTFTKNEVQIHSVRCISELRSFGYHGNGKLSGMNGEHDDLVFALAQFCFLRTIFFFNENMNEWGDEFLENIAREEERIRNNHFSSYETLETSKEKEIMALMQGYSVPDKEMSLWRAKHTNILDP